MNSGLMVKILLIGASLIGVSKANYQTFIVQGEKAAQFQFPWHASIHILRTSEPIRYGGGSLISQNFILTSAVFIDGAQLAQVHLGSIKFSRPLLAMETNLFFTHPQYNSTNRAFDVGLIQLRQNVFFSNNHRPIMLASKIEDGFNFVNVSAFISGFGVTSTNSSYLSEDLNFARQIVISNAQCARNYSADMIHDAVICAVGFNNTAQGPCFGDTGGALVINQNTSWIQIGIATFYPQSGCESGLPTGYIRIASVLDWISRISGITI